MSPTTKAGAPKTNITGKRVENSRVAVEQKTETTGKLTGLLINGCYEWTNYWVHFCWLDFGNICLLVLVLEVNKRTCFAEYTHPFFSLAVFLLSRLVFGSESMR